MATAASGGGSAPACATIHPGVCAQHARTPMLSRHARAASRRDARMAVMESESDFMRGPEYCRRRRAGAVSSHLQRRNCQSRGRRVARFARTDASRGDVARRKALSEVAMLRLSEKARMTAFLSVALHGVRR